MGRQFEATCQRMARFVTELPAASQHTLRVLGCHIEMSSDGGEFTAGTLFQPDEAAYTMTAQDVLDLVRSRRRDPETDKIVVDTAASRTVAYSALLCYCRDEPVGVSNEWWWDNCTD